MHYSLKTGYFWYKQSSSKVVILLMYVERWNHVFSAPVKVSASANQDYLKC